MKYFSKTLDGPIWQTTLLVIFGMLKFVFLVATFVAYGSGSSEFNFGKQTTHFILDFYNQQLAVLPALFQNNIRKFLDDLEDKATAISQAVGKCVHDTAVAVEESLNENVKQVLDAEIDKIDQHLDSLDNLNAEEVDLLWTSVSNEGNFRNDMNAVIMQLKRDVLLQLNNFRTQMTSKCIPLQTINRIVLNRNLRG